MYIALHVRLFWAVNSICLKFVRILEQEKFGMIHFHNDLLSNRTPYCSSSEVMVGGRKGRRIAFKVAFFLNLWTIYQHWLPSALSSPHSSNSVAKFETQKFKDAFVQNCSHPHCFCPSYFCPLLILHVVISNLWLNT